MSRRPDEDSGVLLDDYPRIQRRPDAVADAENQRAQRRPTRARVPRIPPRQLGILAGVLVAGGVLGWCLHPDTEDTGPAARKALAAETARSAALEGELATAKGALATAEAAATKARDDAA